MRTCWAIVAAALALFVLGIVVFGTVLAPTVADRNVPGATTGTGKGSLRE